MAPNDSEDTDAEALKRELMDGLRLVVNFLAAALLTGPRGTSTSWSSKPNTWSA